MTERDDYTTYPGDRHTRLTPAQRERKVNAARGKMLEAMLLLKEVCGLGIKWPAP